MALNAQIALSLVAHEHDTADLARGLRVTTGSYAVALTDGTGANQAQVAWSDSRTIGASPDSLDPASLADTRDGAAVTVTMTAIKGVYIKNSHASNSLTVASTVVSSAGNVTLEAGACLFMVVPTAAGKTPATFTVSGTSGTTYDIILIGEGTVA